MCMNRTPILYKDKTEADRTLKRRLGQVNGYPLTWDEYMTSLVKIVSNMTKEEIRGKL